ncbi:extracellular solute-binding protein [Kribbella sp. NBC_01245]|uniref:ABC transporter substrate-binding protein n=1 Tax=Kribbella sp. NBC_01245 TaxID=2903578 RepID=UPI002E28E973|nr:extracellular solute-binding protein [Kribbella sp. NBC_01245]
MKMMGWVRRRAPRVWRAAVSVAVVTALASSMAACGGGGKTAAEPKVLTMWTFKQSHVKALEAVGAEWGKTSGYTVKVTAYTPDETYATKIRAGGTTKDLPDLITAHSSWEEWSFANAGLLTDLTDKFDDGWKKQLSPSAVTETTLTQQIIDSKAKDPNGNLKNLKADHFYAVPYLMGSAGLVYAYKPALKKAGLDPEKAPESWEDWVTAMRATKAADAKSGGLTVGLQNNLTAYGWLYRPMAFGYLGPEAFKNRQGRNPTTPWDSPQSIATLKLYGQLSDLWMPGVLALGIDQADQAFAQGKASWLVGGTFTLPFVVQQGLKPEDILVFPIPMSKAGAERNVGLHPSPLVSAGVASTSKHQAEATDFLKFLTSPAGAKIFAAESRDVPATAIEPSELDPLIQKMVAAFGEPGANSFKINDWSADPGGGGPITLTTGTELAKLQANKTTPEELGKSLAKQYATAWAGVK